MTSDEQIPHSSGFKRYLIWAIPCIALIALVLLMKASGSGQTEPAPTETKKNLVNTMSIQWRDQYQQKRFVVGSAEASQTTAIGFDLSGAVENIFVDEGQQVTKGQPLAQLDAKRLYAQQTELTAVLNRANSEANLAQLSLTRVVDLVEKKLESAQRLDEATESLNAAKAFVDEVLARQNRLQIEIQKTRLFAPYSGSIVRRHVDIGTVVATGQALFSLQQSKELEVRFALADNRAKTLTVGQNVALNILAKKVQGVVKSIAKQRRLDTRTVDVIVSLQGSEQAVQPGDILQMDIDNVVATKGFWIPRKALVSGVRGLWSLFVVESVDGQQQLTAKLVEMLYADDKKAYVRGALLEGDSVVFEGVHRLVSGQLVTVNNTGESLANAVLGGL